MNTLVPRPAVLASVACVVLVALFVAWKPVSDPDTWWHVAAGEWMRTHGGGDAPPLGFFGAHGCDDATPMDYRLGFPVFGWLWSIGGPAALVAFCILVTLALSIAMWRVVLPALGPAQAAVWGAATAIVVGTRMAARTEAFSYLLLLALFAILPLIQSPQSSRRRLVVGCALIAALFLAWPELHSGVVFGVVALGAALVEGAVGRRTPWPQAVAALGVAVAAILLSSHGMALLAGAPLERSIAREVLAVAEWTSPITQALRGRSDPTLTIGLVLAVAFGVAAFGPALPRLRGVVVGSAFLALALEASRNIAVFGLSGICWLPRLATLKPRVRGGLAVAAALAAASTLVAIGMARGVAFDVGERALLSDEQAPLSASRFAEHAGLQGRVFGGFSNLNYLMVANPELSPIWTGRRTFERGCGEMLIGAEVSPERFYKQADDRWSFDHVLVRVPAEETLFRWLVEHDWQLVFLGSRDAWFVRPEAEAPPRRIAMTPEELLAGERQSLPRKHRATLLLRGCQRLAFAGMLQEALGLCVSATQEDPDDPALQQELARLRRFMVAQGAATGIQ